MDISSLGITGVAAITVICLLIGQGVKASSLDSKFIPIICNITDNKMEHEAQGFSGFYLLKQWHTIHRYNGIKYPLRWSSLFRSNI